MLSIVIFLVFFYQLSLSEYATKIFWTTYGTIPAAVFGNGPWAFAPEVAPVPPWGTLFSSMYLHAGFMHINTFQLMMLPGTEIDSPSTRNKFEMKTRFRILPRCFGYYDVLGKQTIAAEIEEVCISTNTLSFEDYVKCRKK